MSPTLWASSCTVFSPSFCCRSCRGSLGGGWVCQSWVCISLLFLVCVCVCTYLHILCVSASIYMYYNCTYVCMQLCACVWQHQFIAVFCLFCLSAGTLCLDFTVSLLHSGPCCLMQQHTANCSLCALQGQLQCALLRMCVNTVSIIWWHVKKCLSCPD